MDVNSTRYRSVDKNVDSPVLIKSVKTTEYNVDDGH